MKIKLKSHRGAAKRFKTTGNGKIKRGHAFGSHLLTSKSSKRKNNLKKIGMVSDADHAVVKRLIPYS